MGERAMDGEGMSGGVKYKERDAQWPVVKSYTQYRM
jgi:hypothetical protein